MFTKYFVTLLVGTTLILSGCGGESGSTSDRDNTSLPEVNGDSSLLSISSGNNGSDVDFSLGDDQAPQSAGSITIICPETGCIETENDGNLEVTTPDGQDFDVIICETEQINDDCETDSTDKVTVPDDNGTPVIETNPDELDDEGIQITAPQPLILNLSLDNQEFEIPARETLQLAANKESVVVTLSYTLANDALSLQLTSAEEGGLTAQSESLGSIDTTRALISFANELGNPVHLIPSTTVVLDKISVNCDPETANFAELLPDGSQELLTIADPNTGEAIPTNRVIILGDGVENNYPEEGDVPNSITFYSDNIYYVNQTRIEGGAITLACVCYKTTTRDN